MPREGWIQLKDGHYINMNLIVDVVPYQNMWRIYEAGNSEGYLLLTDVEMVPVLKWLEDSDVHNSL